MSTKTANRTATGLPSVWQVGLARGIIEVKQFFRERSGAIFTFAFPAVILLVFGLIESGEVGKTGVSVRQYFTPGIIAMGIVFTSFANLAVAITIERDHGTLKRLALTPMPRAAYFVGKTIHVLVTTVVQIAVLLILGVAFLGVHLPAAPARWLTLGWLLALGVTALTLLGIAVSGLPPSGKSAGVMINLPMILLMFVSGVFSLPFSSLPPWLQQVGALFPVKWIAQGLRSVFLPDNAAVLAPAGTWEHGRTALVLAAWCVAGLVLCLTTFRWKGRHDG